MTETCEPPPEHRGRWLFAVASFGEIADLSNHYWTRRGYRGKPHIWLEHGWWHVGWRYVGPAAVARLLDAWSPRTRPLAELLFATGMRFGAAYRLERKDIDLERAILHSRTKGRGGGKPIVVPLTSKAVAILSALPMPEIGRIWPFTFSQFRWDRERAREAAGLPRWRAHDARHEVGQQLENAGLGQHVADALGHTSQSYRRRYAKARPDVTREALERAQRG